VAHNEKKLTGRGPITDATVRAAKRRKQKASNKGERPSLEGAISSQGEGGERETGANSVGVVEKKKRG